MKVDKRACVPLSSICPSSVKSTLLATSRAKPISWVTMIIVMPSLASDFIRSSTSPTISGSSALVGSSKRITSFVFWYHSYSGNYSTGQDTDDKTQDRDDERILETFQFVYKYSILPLRFGHNLECFVSSR